MAKDGIKVAKDAEREIRKEGREDLHDMKEAAREGYEEVKENVRDEIKSAREAAEEKSRISKTNSKKTNKSL